MDTKMKSFVRGGKNYTVPSSDFNEHKSLIETQAGITEFLNNGLGITGVVKARFSDFQVNEIDLNGCVLELNNLDIPKQVDDGLSSEELEKSKKQLSSIVDEDMWKKISGIVSGDPALENPSNVEINVTDLDKETRTKIHKIMKSIYGKHIISSTITFGDKKLIKITKAENANRKDDRTRWTYPGEYVHFLMYKENLSTNEAAMAIANKLHISPSKVTYCGTKDKRAKTTQKLCVKKREPSQIVRSVKAIPHVHVGNFEFSNSPLRLGDSKGNRFRIVLRLVNACNEDIDRTMNYVKTNGFINYFGLQRFGNCADVPTHEIGIALLRCDYKLACELIMKPRKGDHFYMRPIREKWWKDRNSSEACSMIQNSLSIEKKLLSGLANYGENKYAAALLNIPRNTLLLYPHAYQSLIFNRIASRRIKEFGLKLIPGDLVYRDKNEEDVTEVIEDESDADRNVIDADGDTNEKTQKKEEESIFKAKVKPLTEDDITSGEYTMFDIVLPIPGYDITYPENIVGRWYEEYLEESGLSSQKLRHRIKLYSMPGQYRKLIIKPKNMTWEIKQYDSPQSSLIASDWDKISGGWIPGDSEGKFKALLMDFQLPSAAYATMLLREICKFDTSAASQSQLNKNEMEKHGEIKISSIDIRSSEYVEIPEAASSTEKRKVDNTTEDNDGGIIDTKKLKLIDNL